MFSFRKRRRWLSFLVVAVAPLIVFSSVCFGYGQASQCPPLLKRLTVLDLVDLNNLFSKYKFKPLKNNGGFTLTLQGTEGEELVGSRGVLVPSDAIDSDFLSKNVSKNIWTIGPDQYEFVNVGFRSLEGYSARVNEIVLNHLMNFPNQNLTVVYDPMRSSLGQRLRIHRWTIHEAVIEAYIERKPYLSDEDLRVLRAVNTYSDNSDVFALLKYESPNPKSDSSFLNLSAASIHNRLLFTTQISYFGDRNFFSPSFRHMVMASKHPIPDDIDMLPFEYRIRKEVLPAFRAAFYERFEARKTAEITRDSLRDPQLPKAIHDNFILNIFRTAESRGVKHLVIGVDKATGRLFRRYGFRPYGILPTNSGVSEYLYYLNIDSSEFRSTVDDLSRGEQSVKITLEPMQ